MKKMVLAFPIYYHGISGLLKCTLDRFSGSSPRSGVINWLAELEL